MLHLARMPSSDHLDEFGVTGPKTTTQTKTRAENNISKPAPAAKTIKTQSLPRTLEEEVAWCRDLAGMCPTRPIAKG